MDDRSLEWQRLALRWAQFTAGMVGFGLAVALMVRSGLGLGPWDAFHTGMHAQMGISIGTANIVAGVGIVAITWCIGERPRLGTLANMLLIGLFIDLFLPHVPAAPGWGWALAYYLVAIALVGLSSGLYIAPALGKGPRDGLALVLCRKTGWSLRRVRTLIELSVLGCGWMMGGPVGVGTVLFSLLAGPSMQWGLERFGVLTPTPRRAPRTLRVREGGAAV